MATKKRSTSAPRPETLAPRHLWLAGLGLLSLTRKRVQAAAADAASGANTLVALVALVAQLADDAESNVREGAAALRGQVQPLSAEVEARLQPVLVKLGLQPKPRATPRKRPAATEPAKRATKKTAAPRRVAKRSARSQ
ncbi:hypothetical protein [Xanthomonas translucens]|uniref:hypothetical protein n=1 Tax=Xanthomonas campestris pv. translucens TaxID=343 RepID=UPI00071BED29|nr:hypothetical protein [Xanthomonas translucens]